jgi:hypothetical protein
MAPLHASLSLSFSLSVKASKGRVAQIPGRHKSTCSRSTNNCFSHSWTARTSGMWDDFSSAHLSPHDCQYEVGVTRTHRCRPDTGPACSVFMDGGVMHWAGFRLTTFISHSENYFISLIAVN